MTWSKFHSLWQYGRWAAACGLFGVCCSHVYTAELAVTNRQDRLEVVAVFTPPVVRLGQGNLLTLRITGPENVQVQLPEIAGRLTGFEIAGSFRRPPVVAAAMRTQEICFHLKPLVSGEYRLGPLAVGYGAAHGNTNELHWLVTSPVVLQREATVKPAVGDIIGPRRLRLSPKILLSWLVWLAGAGLLAAALWLAGRRLWQAWRIRKMSPRQLALYELARLLSGRLREAGQYKEFFAALAGIVRRYIENAHAIRAPEQTTEEFLRAAAADARFSSAVVEKLSKFLQTADLVKFAAWQPPAEVLDQAVQTAREYIETDDNAENTQVQGGNQG